MCVCSLSLSLLARPPSAREHFFPNLVCLLFFSISVLFPLRSFRLRARIHSFALCPACFSFVRSVSFFFSFASSSSRSRRSCCNASSCLVSSFLFGSAEHARDRARGYLPSAIGHIPNTLANTRSRCGIPYSPFWSVSLYFVSLEVRARSPDNNRTCKLTYIPFSVVNVFAECRIAHNFVLSTRSELSWQYIQYRCRRCCRWHCFCFDSGSRIGDLFVIGFVEREMCEDE